MTNPIPPVPTMAENILAEIRDLKAETTILHRLASLLMGPNETDDNFLGTMTRLLSLLVAGTEETHRSLAALHATIREPGIARELRRAMLDD